jgi:hypothetical protein
MMERNIGFVGYDLIPPVTERTDIVSPDQLEFMKEAIALAPNGKAAVFLCDDSFHAVKVADRLRYLLGEDFYFTARRSLVYAKKKDKAEA